MNDDDAQTLIAIMRDIALNLDLLNDHIIGLSARVYNTNMALEAIHQAMPEKDWFVIGE